MIHNDYEGDKKNSHKSCLRMIHDDYESDYETLLEKNGKPTMEIKTTKQLAV